MIRDRAQAGFAKIILVALSGGGVTFAADQLIKPTYLKPPEIRETNTLYGAARASPAKVYAPDPDLADLTTQTIVTRASGFGIGILGGVLLLRLVREKVITRA